MKKEILAGQVEEIIRSCGGKYLEHCELFDIYEGAQIAQGFKSMAYSVSFRAQDKTLEDAEVNAAMARVTGGNFAMPVYFTLKPAFSTICGISSTAAYTFSPMP